MTHPTSADRLLGKVGGTCLIAAPLLLSLNSLLHFNDATRFGGWLAQMYAMTLFIPAVLALARLRGDAAQLGDERGQRLEIHARVALRVVERGDDGVQIRLAGLAAHRGDGAIGDMHARVSGLQHGGGVNPAGVVGVKVNWDPDLLP